MVLAAIFATATVVSFAKETALNYLKDGKPDAAAVLPPPPSGFCRAGCGFGGSETCLSCRQRRGQGGGPCGKEIHRLQFHQEAAGAFLVETNLPKTTAFFEKVQADAETVTDAGKDFFKRPRPYTTNPHLRQRQAGKKLRLSQRPFHPFHGAGPRACGIAAGQA